MSNGQIETWSRIRQIFDDAVQMEPNAREAFLTGACAGQPEVESQVRELLEIHGGVGEFLEHSPLKGQTGLVSQLAKGMEDSFVSSLLKSRYEVHERIGQGGFGCCYRATDRELEGREVVVKTLREQGANATAAEWFGRRFQLEKQALAKVDHPSVVGVLDAGESLEGIPFLVMQFVRGKTLRQVLAEGPMDPQRVWRLAGQLADGLDAAHSVSVLHRDIKPENIVVRDAGSPKEVGVLIDFGIARIESAEPSATTAYILGTPDYMAPEHIKGKAEAASDQFSLALVIFEALTGKKLVDVDKTGQPGLAVDRLLQQLAPAAPKKARAAIQRALAHDPYIRFDSVSDFASALAPPARTGVSRRSAVFGYAASLVAGGFMVYGLYSVGGGGNGKPVTVTLTVSEKSGGKPRPVDPDSRVFHGGDEIRLEFSASLGGFFYLINEGSSSRMDQPKFILLHAGKVSNNQRVGVPARDNAWIRIDGKPGTEVIWVVWSKTQVTEFAALERFRQAGGLVEDKNIAMALRRQLSSSREAGERIVKEIRLHHE